MVPRTLVLGRRALAPHDDARSNYRMVKEALLSQAPIPSGNIHAIPTDKIDPHEAAAAYERSLKYFMEPIDSIRPGRCST